MISMRKRERAAANDGRAAGGGFSYFPFLPRRKDDATNWFAAEKRKIQAHRFLETNNICRVEEGKKLLSRKNIQLSNFEEIQLIRIESAE